MSNVLITVATRLMSMELALAEALYTRRRSNYQQVLTINELSLRSMTSLSNQHLAFTFEPPYTALHGPLLVRW